MTCTITMRKNGVDSVFVGNDYNGEVDDFMDACWAYFEAHHKEHNPDQSIEEYPYNVVPCSELELHHFIINEDPGTVIVSIDHK